MSFAIESGLAPGAIAALEEQTQRIQHNPAQFATWAVFIGETAGDGAADWVRSLWQPGTVQAWTSSSVPNSASIAVGTFVSTRAYLTARCLPPSRKAWHTCAITCYSIRRWMVN